MGLGLVPEETCPGRRGRTLGWSSLKAPRRRSDTAMSSYEAKLLPPRANSLKIQHGKLRDGNGERDFSSVAVYQS